MTTLLETERQFLALWAEMEREQSRLGEDWTDDHIDHWAGRLGPYQVRIETAARTSNEDALVIMRHVARLTAGCGLTLSAEPLQHVADWLEPGHGLTCNDPRILRPCPFCGEREHLSIEEGTFERVGVRNGKVDELVWNRKQTVITNAEYADTIQCQVCDTITALDVWNHTRPASDYALLRDFDPPEIEAEVEVEAPKTRRAA